MQNRPWLLVALVLVAIIYGSLYPFALHVPPGDEGALTSFLATWRRPPQSRGDLLANLLFYFPFGLLAVRALVEKLDYKTALILTVASGALLSLSMELLQHFDAGRVSAMSDFYLNSTGTAAGAVAGLLWGQKLLALTIVPRDASLFAALLLLAWLGWRLFPYEPVIDLHKYWASVKPLLLSPSFDIYEMFRYATLWGAVTYLIQFGLKVLKPYLAVPAAMAAFFLAKMLIVDQVITFLEIIGALAALGFLIFVLNPQRTLGTRLLAAAFLVSIALERILPLQMSAAARPFEWIPFFSFLHGSLAVNTQSFMQKTFLYGAALVLLMDAGLGLVGASLFEGAVLAATSVFETLLVGRSAEITDAVMVILLALVCHALTTMRPHARNEALPRGSGRI